MGTEAVGWDVPGQRNEVPPFARYKGAKDGAPGRLCWGEENNGNRGSFDCASRDETARGYAQDDKFMIERVLKREEDPAKALC